MNRVVSIDVFRALTMVLMVFVNDLWTITGVPHWLEHAGVREDSLGLSDIVFPAFLFIVGLSIPFAIDSRLKKKEKKVSIFLHIIMRSFALIIMGFFFVNQQYFHPDVPYSLRNFWKILTVAGFFLLWNHYEKPKVFKFIPVWFFQSFGAFLLIYVAYLYKGGTYENPSWMQPHWWGILGLIGWSYLLVSVIYLVSGKRLWIVAPFLVFFFALNVQEFKPLLGIYRFKLLISASNYALVTSGLLSALLFLKVQGSRYEKYFPFLILFPALVLGCFGFNSRPYWGISKILATPSWTAITAALSFSLFAAIFLITDIYRHTWWTRPIMPAGRSTLTCYFLPIIAYSAFYPYLVKIPAHYTTGIAGLGKSAAFAFTIVFVTWVLEKLKIKVRL